MPSKVVEMLKTKKGSSTKSGLLWLLRRRGGCCGRSSLHGVMHVSCWRLYDKGVHAETLNPKPESPEARISQQSVGLLAWWGALEQGC